MIKSQKEIFIDFLQFCIGATQDFLGSLVKADWKIMYDIAKKQALLGVVFDGVQKLPKEAAPCQDLLMTWFGQCQRIKRRNVIINEATAKIYERIKAEGFRCCILKG